MSQKSRLIDWYLPTVLILGGSPANSPVPSIKSPETVGPCSSIIRSPLLSVVRVCLCLTPPCLKVAASGFEIFFDFPSGLSGFLQAIPPTALDELVKCGTSLAMNTAYP